MEKQVQNLLASAASKDVTLGRSAVNEAFMLLKNANDSQPKDAPQTVPEYLFVICAETALRVQQRETARASIQIYFNKCPVIDQYTCRAYLTQANLLAPSTATSFEDVERMGVYILKCVYSARENTKWHYLVYNASVLFWQLTRPFMKANYFRCLSPSLSHIVKALDDINDRDYEWRGQLVMLLLQSFLDAGDKPNALVVANKYMPFLKDNAPRQFRELFVLMVRHQLIDIAKLQKDTKLFAALSVTYRLCKLKTAVEENDEVNVAAEVSSILKAVSGEAEASASTLGAGTSNSSKRERSAKRTTEKSDTGGSRSSLKGEWRDQSNRGNILLELARLAIKMHCYEAANDCLVAMQQDSVMSADMKDASVVLGAQFARCEVAAAQLPANYTRPIVEARLKIVERCEELLINASRIQKPNVVQAGCGTLWNLVQPLLQSELRQNVVRALLLCAEQLEQTNSLLSQLRTQVHIELARCYEQQQQISNALAHLDKALQLDEDGTQRERIELLRGRLRLRTDLYLVPKRVEEEAAMIIEQLQTAQRHSEKRGSNKAAVGGSSQRALLTQAGSVLSPDAFLEVLQGEEEQALIAADLIQRTEVMHGKVQRYRSTVSKPEGHVRRLATFNDKERVVLWTDLVKLARKQEVWDIVRVASRFCLSYDDNRWHVPVVQPENTGKRKKRGEKRGDDSAVTAATSGTTTAPQDAPVPVSTPAAPPAEGSPMEGPPPDAVEQPDAQDAEPEPPPPSFTPKRPGFSLFERDLLRMLAETHLIFAEAHIQHLLSMNIRYCDQPQKPNWTERQLKLIKIRKSTANNDDQWTAFFEWVREIHQIIATSLARAVQLATDLQEPHLITNVACVLWNYGYHLLTEQRHRSLLEQFKMCLDAFRKLNQFPESTLLVNLTCAVAQGFLQPWLPKDFLYAYNPAAITNLKADDGDAKKEHGKRSVVSATTKKTGGPTAAPEAQQDLKEALEACTFTMQLTAGENAKMAANNRVRQPLLQLWTMLKQLTQQQINRHLGADDSDAKEGSRSFTRAIVGVEMMWINGNGIYDLRETPDFKEITSLMEACDWVGRDERVLELELWTRLAILAFNNATQPSQGGSTTQQQLSETFSKLVQRAVNVFTERELSKMPVESNDTSAVFELLTHCWCLQGRFVMNVAKPSQKTRLQAIKCFGKAAVYAKAASNYRLVSYAARYFWNTAFPLTSDAVDRRVLRDDLVLLLDAFVKTADAKIVAEISESGAEQSAAANDEEEEREKEEEEQEQLRQVSMFEIQIKNKLGLFFLPLQAPHLLVFKLKSDIRDDLSLRTTMTAVLFQIFADEGNWEEGIKVLDEAINNMPKTKHRLALIQHRLLVKARLGKSVYADMQKFKDEDERTLAAMWRRVALCTSDVDMQILAFQRAIETLTTLENEWQKCEYLLEFATCLYNHGFSSNQCTRAVDWAIDILLNFAVSEQLRSRSEVASSRESVARKSMPKTSKPSGVQLSEAGTASSSNLKSKKSRLSDNKKSKALTGSSLMATQRSEVTNASTPFAALEGVISSRTDEQDEVPLAARKPVSVAFEEIQDVQLLDLLMRAYVQLAQLGGPQSPQKEAHLLQAAACVLQTLRVSIVTGQSGTKSTSKPIASAQPPAEKPAKGSKGKDAGKDNKEKPAKRKAASYDGVPGSWSEWATFDMSEETLEVLRQHDFVRKRAPTSSTVTQPEITVSIVRQLTDQLRRLGLHYLALPLLVYENLLCRLFIPELPACQMLVRLKLVKLCQELNLLSANAFHDKALTDLRISDDDRARSRAEIALWHEKNRRLQLASELSYKKKKETVKENTNVQASHDNASHTPTELLKLPTLRQLWTQIATALIDLGMYQYAREYLLEASESANAFSDIATKREILYLLAKISHAENDCKNAVLYAKQTVSEQPFGDQRTVAAAVAAAARADADWRVSSDLHYRAAVIIADSVEHDVSRKHPLREAMLELSTQMAITVEFYNDKRRKFAGRAKDEQPASNSELEWCLLQFETKLLDLQIKQCQRYLENSIGAQESAAQCERRLRNLLCVLDKWSENYEASLDYEPRVALRMMLRHAKVLETVPIYLEQFCQAGLRQRETNEQQLQERQTYMTIYALYRRALALSQGQYAALMDKMDSPGMDSHSLCLPLEREFADLRIHYCEFLLKLLRLHAVEADRVRQIARSKDNLELAHDVFLQDEVNHYDLSDEAQIAETKWARLCTELPDEIAQTLLEAQSLVRYHKSTITARYLALLGTCWHVHSQIVSADSALQWSFSQLESEIMKTNAFVRQTREEQPSNLPHYSIALGRASSTGSATERTAVTEDINVDEIANDPDSLKWRQRVTQYKAAFETSMSYVRLSTQYLGQAINLCLENTAAINLNVSTCSQASFELVEVLGQYDPGLAAQFLMLAQSNQFVKFATDVIRKLQFDTGKSQFAALLRQQQLLIENDLAENGTNTSLFETIDSTLMRTTEAWPRLKLSKNHLDLSKDFAINFNFAVLQFNEDRTALYAAVFDKQHFKAKAPKGGVSNLQSRTTVMKLDNSERQMDFLWYKFSMHKNNLMRELLQIENKRSQIAERKKLVETVSGAGRESNSSSSNDNALALMNQAVLGGDVDFERHDVQIFYQECEFEFWTLMQDLDKHLRPFTRHLEIIHRPVSATTETKSVTTSKHDRENSEQHSRGATAQPTAGQPPKEPVATDYIVLLCDIMLFDLPLEALSIFQHAESVCSVTREFSLQMHYRRAHVTDPGNEPRTVTSLEDKKKLAMSRIPALRDAVKAKQGKMQYLDRQVPAWCSAVDVSNFRYIVDPHNECQPLNFAPIPQFQQAMQREQACTSRWIGVLGSDHVPSLAEYEVYWKEGTSFIFYGVERLQYEMSFSRIASLSVSDCSIAAFFDLVQTVKSNLRVAKLEIDKRPIELEYESSPVLRAMLVSLAGVSCVLTNQWYTTLRDNADKFQVTSRALLGIGKSVGETCRLLQTAPRKVQLSVAQSGSAPSSVHQPAAAMDNAPGLSTVESSRLQAPEAARSANGESAMFSARTDSGEEEQQSLTSGQSEVFTAKREWYNTVCYGLPNLIAGNV